jgi:hypothetical protein
MTFDTPATCAAAAAAAPAIAAGDQHVHVAAALGGRGHGVEGAALQGGVVVFSDNECDHDIFYPGINLFR